jgi:hypothetical protein
MYSYKQFTRDARLMESVLSRATEELKTISDKLATADATVESMAPEIRRLSTPDAMPEFNEFVVRKYHPALSAQAALTAEVKMQTERLGSMQQAMHEPEYLADLEASAVADLEMSLHKARLEEERLWQERLLSEAVRKTDEAEIRRKIKPEFTYPDYLADKPSPLEEGVIARTSAYKGGRTMTVYWSTPCVVVHAAGGDYVVCLFDQFDHDRLIYRIVGEDEIHGPAL